MTPVSKQLRKLHRAGFYGERLFNEDGHFEALYYTRDVAGIRETLLIWSENDTLGYRTRDVLDLDSPFITNENAVEWRLISNLATVINALLSLPTPSEPLLPLWPYSNQKGVPSNMDNRKPPSRSP